MQGAWRGGGGVLQSLAMVSALLHLAAAYRRRTPLVDLTTLLTEFTWL